MPSFTPLSSARRKNPFRNPGPFESGVEVVRSIAIWLLVAARAVLSRSNAFVRFRPTVARTLGRFIGDARAFAPAAALEQRPEGSPPKSEGDHRTAARSWPEASAPAPAPGGRGRTGPRAPGTWTLVQAASPGEEHRGDAPIARLDPVGAATLLVTLNGLERSVPLPDLAGPDGRALRIAAAAVARGEGCRGETFQVRMAKAQIQLCGVRNLDLAWRRISALSAEVLQRGVEALGDRPVPIGRVPSLRLQVMGNDSLVVSLQAEGDVSIPLVESVARGIAPLLIQLAEPTVQPQLIVGITQPEILRVSCFVEPAAFFEASRALRVARHESELMGQLRKSSGDGHDPERAARDNREVIARMSEACSSLHLDRDRLHRDALDHANRWGSCEPLVRWSAFDHGLRGQLVLPVSAVAPTSSGRGHDAGGGLPLVGSVGLVASLAGIVRGLSARSSLSTIWEKTPRWSRLDSTSTNGSSRFRPPDESGVRPSIRGARAVAH